MIAATERRGEGRRRKAIAVAILATALFCVAGGDALAARSEWSPADHAQMRLLLAGRENERIVGGVELLLSPGWHTYWRNPGESGVPPVFDFSGSDNVASVEILYPAPLRYDDGASVSLVYHDEVVFPLIVTPQAADRPITLRLEAQFGVCSEVCIPTGASAELAMPITAPADPLAEARLDRFLPYVPKAPDPGRLDIEQVTADGDALIIDVRMPDSSYSDLFVEPPAGWYLPQPVFVARDEGVSRYRLSLAGRPAGATYGGQTFRFVAAAGGEAIEESIVIE
jgi:DsbC/DsbD-like thiol-disulfide interchange protein